MTIHPARPVNRRPTLADVADAAGVSVPLVSVVMRDAPGASAATRERVRRIADDLGYRPDQRARLLRQQHTRLLGVTFEIEQAFHGDLVSGLYAAAKDLGYTLSLSAVAPRRAEADAVQSILDDRCEAVIMVGPRAPTRELVRVAARLPLVVLARNVRSTSVDCVRTDDRTGMGAAVDHLMELGHRRIAYLDGGATAGAADRLRAFRSAVSAAGLADSSLVFPAGPVEEDGATAARTLLNRATDVTAVIAFNDRCAMGVVDTVLRAGLRVPQDMSVVGYDDSRLSRISYLDLTSVGQNPAELAAIAVRRAVSRVENDASGPRDQVVASKLVVRTSTATSAADRGRTTAG